MKTQNKDLLLTTAELLASSDSYGTRIPYQYSPSEYIPSSQRPLYTYSTDEHVNLPQNNNPIPSPYNPETQNEIGYYKNMILEMNKEIGNINSKLSQIDNSMTVSRMSSIDYDNCMSSRSNKSNLKIESDMAATIRNNYTMSMLDKDKKLIQLEENRKKLIDKNKELERQLTQLEQFANKTTMTNSSNPSTIEKKEETKTRYRSKSKSPSAKKNYKRANSTKVKHINNDFNRTITTTNNIRKIPSGDKEVDNIKSQIDAIKKMVMNNTNNKNIIDQLNSLQSCITGYLKTVKADHKVLYDKQNKQIEKLTKENNELKKKVTKIKEIMK